MVFSFDILISHDSVSLQSHIRVTRFIHEQLVQITQTSRSFKQTMSRFGLPVVNYHTFTVSGPYRNQYAQRP